MTREEAKILLPIIQAYAEGKTIQVIDTTDQCGTWENVTDLKINTGFEEYRIKSEQKYCPFRNTKECWQEMQKHQPFGWIKSTLFKELVLVKRVTTLYIEINRDIIDYKDALEKFTFADGTPFGLKVEE